jgi:glutamyl-tRNA reductase
MSALSAATLSRAGVTDIVVANRTHARALRLAESVGGRAVRLSEVPAELAAADLVVSCTGAGNLVITTDMVARAIRAHAEHAAPHGPSASPEAPAGSAATGRRGGLEASPSRLPAPLFVLDLALPHDVDPAVRLLPGVTLVDLESMQEAGLGSAGRGGEAVEAAERIVAAEVTAFLEAERAARVTPTVVALRSKAAMVVEAELGRLVARMPELDGRTRDEVTQTVRRVVDKLLHEPTVRVKRLAASPAGDHYAEALRELFNLDPKAPDAVTRADVEKP